jgi:hypothetical protein
MAKRSRTGGRPAGQRRPHPRPATKPAPRPAASLTPDEEARAAELEAAIVAGEKAADEARKGRDRLGPASESVTYSSVPLAERAAQEYGYVQRDLKRIAIVGGGLLLAMVGIDILLNVTNII